MHSLTQNQDYKTQAEDTSPEAERILVEAWRRMAPWQKIESVLRINRASDDIATAGILMRHPGATPDEIRLRLAALRLDRDTMVKAFGWDPERNGY
ncbi:MAG: hypothetical protein AAB074_00655 [Planctomycetota bacterium]